MIQVGVETLALTREPATEPDTAERERDTVRLAAKGDARAFERLYRGHSARIHSLSRRMIGVHDADEMTQDIFSRAWEKLGSFRGESSFGTWLYRVGMNLILERRQALAIRRGRHTASHEVLDDLASAPVSTDERMDFEAALENLPQGAREILVLHDVEGYKHEEIDKMLGINAGTSKSQLHRARMTLRRYLER